MSGRPPLEATVWELQKLRCNLCGEVFTARPPQGVGTARYDATVASMIGLLKYGSGMPFNRLAGPEGNPGVPLPAATQWEIVSEAAAQMAPVHEELMRQAAQGQVLYNDDTNMKILQWMGKHRPQEPSERKGIFTSGIVSTREGRRIALYFTGRKHAGENLEAVLKQRAAQASRPIQMCDALSRNVSGEFDTIVANCLAHGRRQFVEVSENFPGECRHVLEVLRDVYRHDAITRQKRMDDAERLRFHQVNSGPLMDDLHAWMTQQIEQKRIEPNSGLGEAIGYMLKHWKGLTLFLREPGAPPDNNLCERALKKAILHRKNALFYKTDNGARVGDLFMSLIHTCELAETNPFEYLTALLRNARAVAAGAHEWMPWNYREALARRALRAGGSSTRRAAAPAGR